jgi:hypothetical protein
MKPCRVDVEALVGGDDGGGADLLDLVVGGAALDALAVLLGEALKPGDGVVDEVGEVVLCLLDVDLDLFDLLVGLESVVLRDALDADLGEAGEVVVGDGAAEELEEGLQALADLGEDVLPSLDFSMRR